MKSLNMSMVLIMALQGIDLRSIPVDTFNLPFLAIFLLVQGLLQLALAAEAEGGSISDADFKSKLDSFYVQRENLSSAIGSGNRAFTTATAFKIK